MIEFEFDDWSNLYKTDPQAFEQRRGAALETFIQEAPEHTRLRLQQTLFRIEMARKTAKSPLQSAISASKLMWESYGKLRDHVEAIAKDVTAQQNRGNLRLVTDKPLSENTQAVLERNGARIFQIRRQDSSGT